MKTQQQIENEIKRITGTIKHFKKLEQSYCELDCYKDAMSIRHQIINLQTEIKSLQWVLGEDHE